MSITTNVVTEKMITETSAVSGGVISAVTGEFYPITHRLLINKFQLLKVSNQRINADIKARFDLQPFLLFEDRKQADKKFVLTGFQFRPISGIYSDVQLNEYDNTTDMTLNIVE